MMRTVSVLVMMLLFCFSLSAQDKKVNTVARPNIPGSFIVDFGINRVVNEPTLFKYGAFGSRTLNLYYQYPIRFGRSKFSFNPGIGISFERFRLKNYHTLSNVVETKGEPIERYQLVPADSVMPGVRKIMLTNNYFDVPIEIRFDTKPEDISRSFNIAVGGRVGYLFESHLKYKYKEDGDNKVAKDRQNFGLTKLRYGVYTRIGIGGFNWFCFWNLTPLFQSGKGPQSTTMNSFTAGISINGF